MSKAARLLWKIPVALLVIVIGTFMANQAGWSGADLMLNTDLMGFFEHLITAFMFFASLALCYGAVVLVDRLTKPMLWLLVPLFLYSGVVMGAWNGFMSDFDSTRSAVIRHRYANAYALNHMTARGRYRSCNDQRISLTDDAQAVCERVMKGAPGEIIAGSEHHCGVFGILTCYSTAPLK
jgi:hypothetical protein